MQNLLLTIDKSFPDVKQIETAELAKLMEISKETLLFDVRTPQEFAVSHLKGAERIDPLAEWNNKTIQRFTMNTNLKNKTIVFYCSVGYRSSQLASYLQKALQKQKIKDTYNLRGGIFAWHNESRPLINQNAPTKLVHPFNNNYQKYIIHNDLASY